MAMTAVTVANFPTQNTSTQKPLPSSQSTQKSLQLQGLFPPQSPAPITRGSVRTHHPNRESRDSFQLMIHRSILLLSRTRHPFLPWMPGRRLGNVEFVVCQDGDGKLQAFHNVCRHHLMLLAYGSGRKSCFVCPYHINGALLKATRITGIQNFNEQEFGLVPLKVATWGPFILLNIKQNVDSDPESVQNEWLGSSAEVLSNNGIDTSVFCDNYLDGGYHVPYAHKGLASGLNLDGYSTTIRFR